MNMFSRQRTESQVDQGSRTYFTIALSFKKKEKYKDPTTVTSVTTCVTGYG